MFSYISLKKKNRMHYGKVPIHDMPKGIVKFFLFLVKIIYSFFLFLVKNLLNLIDPS